MLRVLAVAIAVSGCMQKPPPVVPACPGAFKELPDSLKEAGGECACPLGSGSGSVWGSGPYTEDSQLCRAAVHAGAVDPAKGGPVKFKGAAGCERYRASAQNGVATASWRSFPKSFVFPGHGEQGCPAPIADECPATFHAVPAGQTELFSCTCTDDAASEGTVWGSGTYTRDSSICRAAVHAGAAKPGGGKVTVRGVPGCVKYEGSTKNGITTESWGAYEGSFYFEDYGHGECARPPKDACPAAFPDSTEEPLTCTCTGAETGTVWGSGIYTRDSSICVAARHTGLAAGRITAYPAKACRFYEGSSQNGVTTAGWGPYEEGSFVFDNARECAR